MIPAWLHPVTCVVPDCGIQQPLWFGVDRDKDERERLVTRALTGMDWLLVRGHAFCPKHVESLRRSVERDPHGKDADAILWALAGRFNLLRIEVR